MSQNIDNCNLIFSFQIFWDWDRSFFLRDWSHLSGTGTPQKGSYVNSGARQGGSRVCAHKHPKFLQISTTIKGGDGTPKKSTLG